MIASCITIGPNGIIEVQSVTVDYRYRKAALPRSVVTLQ